MFKNIQKMFKDIQKMLKGLNDVELQSVMNYCKRETRTRSLFDAFDNIFSESNRIIAIHLNNGNIVYIDNILEIISLTDGVAARFSILGKNPKITKETVRLEFKDNFVELPFSNCKATISFGADKCYYMSELGGVKVEDENIPVTALSVCRLYHDCMDIPTVVSTETKEVETTSEKKSKHLPFRHCSSNYTKELLDIIDSIKELSDTQSNDEVTPVQDESSNKNNKVVELQNSLIALSNYVDGNDDVTLFVTSKEEKKMQEPNKWTKGLVTRLYTRTSSNIYNKLKVTSTDSGADLTFSNSMYPDEFNVSVHLNDDSSCPLTITKTGQIKIRVDDSSIISLIVSKNGTDLEEEQLLNLLYS